MYWVVSRDCCALSHQLLDKRPQIVPRARIESRGGFIQEKDGRPTNQAGCQVESSPHPARIGLDRLVARDKQRHSFESLLSPMLVLALIQVIQQSDQFEVLAPGQEFVDRGVLTGEPDHRPDRLGIIADVETRDGRSTAVRLQQGREHSNQGRLAGTVWAEERQNPPGLDLERHIIECQRGAEPLAYVLDFDRNFHPGAPGISARDRTVIVSQIFPISFARPAPGRCDPSQAARRRCRKPVG